MPKKIDFKIIIPARYGSSRFEGKLLKKIGDFSILERVHRQAQKSGPKDLIIATDDHRIQELATSFGALVYFSQNQHQSGTERIAEVAKAKNWVNDEIIINLQADEPFINPNHLKQLAKHILQHDSKMATLATPIKESEIHNNNCVKVVLNHQDQALYFSRAPIPQIRTDHSADATYVKLRNQNCLRHIGVYGFKADFLQQFIAYPPCDLETIESLEQLRALHYGHAIEVLKVKTKLNEIGIDTVAQLNQVNSNTNQESQP